MRPTMIHLYATAFHGLLSVHISVAVVVFEDRPPARSPLVASLAKRRAHLLETFFTFFLNRLVQGFVLNNLFAVARVHALTSF